LSRGFRFSKFCSALLTSRHGSFSLPFVLNQLGTVRTSKPWILFSHAVWPCLFFWFLFAGLSQPETDDFIPAQRSQFVTQRPAYFIKPRKCDRPDILKVVFVGTSAVFTVSFYLIFIVGISDQPLHRFGVLGNLSVRAPPSLS
jgi:hypothetical protein